MHETKIEKLRVFSFSIFSFPFPFYMFMDFFRKVKNLIVLRLYLFFYKKIKIYFIIVCDDLIVKSYIVNLKEVFVQGLK